MQLQSIIATQPLAIALSYLSTIITHDISIPSTPDVRDEYAILIDANAIPWRVQYQQYLIAVGGHAIPDPQPPPLADFYTAEPEPEFRSLPIARSTSQRFIISTWIAEQEEPFTQLDSRQGNDIPRQTVNGIFNDLLRIGYIEQAGLLVEGSRHANMYQYTGRANPYGE
jgi:hypothetical protein